MSDPMPAELRQVAREWVRVYCSANAVVKLSEKAAYSDTAARAGHAVAAAAKAAYDAAYAAADAAYAAADTAARAYADMLASRGTRGWDAAHDEAMA